MTDSKQCDIISELLSPFAQLELKKNLHKIIMNKFSNELLYVLHSRLMRECYMMYMIEDWLS